MNYVITFWGLCRPPTPPPLPKYEELEAVIYGQPVMLMEEQPRLGPGTFCQGELC